MFYYVSMTAESQAPCSNCQNSLASAWKQTVLGTDFPFTKPGLFGYTFFKPPPCLSVELVPSLKFPSSSCRLWRWQKMIVCSEQSLSCSATFFVFQRNAAKSLTLPSCRKRRCKSSTYEKTATPAKSCKDSCIGRYFYRNIDFRDVQIHLKNL